MTSREKEVGIRLSVKDKDLVERALKSLGKEGQEALERIEKAADKSAVSLQALNAAAGVADKGMQRLKTGVALAAAGIATGFTLGIRAAISRLEEMDRMSAQVDRALANTGNTAKTSAAELADFADQLELRTGRAAEEIMAIGGNLATFKFDHEVFYRSIELANDMSAAWGGELRQNLEGLSRALADPEKGFAMLEKRGISLSEAQGDLVKRFMAVNDLASAQRVILNALEADVKGVAEEGMTPMQRATLAAEKAIENLFEDLVRGEEGGDDLRLSVERVARTLSDPNVLAAVRMFGKILIDSLRIALEFIGGVAAGLQRLMDFFSDLEGKSDAGLESAAYDAEQRIAVLQRQIDEKKAQVAREGNLNAGIANLDITEWQNQIAELRAQEAQIREMQDRRAAAASLTAPLTSPFSITPSDSDGDLPPPVLTKDQEREQARAMQEAQRLTERLRTAAEAYATSLAQVDTMLARGLITQETHNRAVAAAAIEFAGAASTAEEYRLAQDALVRALADGIVTEQQYTEAVEAMTQRRLAASNDWITGLERGLDRIAREGRNFGGDIEDTLVSAATGFEDALVEAFKTGKLEWGDLREQIMADVLRMGIRQGLGGLGSLVSSFIPGFGGGMNFGVQAGVGHDGAIFGAAKIARVVAPEVFAGAQRHHTGTDFLKPGEVPFIGMRGEEIGWPADLRRKYGGRTEVSVQHRTEIHNYSPEPVREERVRGADGVDVSRIIIGEVNKGLAEGRFDTAMSSTYGLRRQGRG